MNKVKRLLQFTAFEVVKEHDWTMPKFSEAEYGDFNTYECECLDIGHDYESDIAEIV